MSYLYFSWHVLAVFVITLVTNVIIHLHASIPLTLHMTTNHPTLTTTVANISAGYGQVNTGLTVLTQKAGGDASNKQDKDLAKSVENLSDVKIIETKTSVSDSEHNSSFESVPTQLFSVIDSDHCERMSPLEEFNTLHRHCEGVRKSIKLKESSIV